MKKIELEKSSLTPRTLYMQKFDYFFAMIENLSNNLKDVFENLHQKEYIIVKYRELKSKANLYSNDYFAFIWPTSNLKYILEMLIYELKYKLTLYL